MVVKAVGLKLFRSLTLINSYRVGVLTAGLGSFSGGGEDQQETVSAYAVMVKASGTSDKVTSSCCDDLWSDGQVLQPDVERRC